MSRAILIIGANGKQGGAVIDALLRRNDTSDFLLLAVTRTPQSASAKRLAARSPSIKLVEGDLDRTSALFTAAKTAAGPAALWGVFSIQVMGTSAKTSKEVAQGTALIDEAVRAGVQHFVYTSVDRGGDGRSWTNPTLVPRFVTKHQIEHHLRDATASGKSPVGWTILRPVIFMDNLAPGFFGKVFLTMIRDKMRGKPLQWVATKDIRVFAAQAFLNPGL